MRWLDNLLEGIDDVRPSGAATGCFVLLRRGIYGPHLLHLLHFRSCQSESSYGNNDFYSKKTKAQYKIVTHTILSILLIFILHQHLILCWAANIVCLTRTHVNALSLFLSHSLSFIWSHEHTHAVRWTTSEPLLDAVTTAYIICNELTLLILWFFLWER